MAENKNAQQVREITDKLEQGIKETRMRSTPTPPMWAMWGLSIPKA